jgi:type VI secretion system protein ImpC
MSTEQAFLQEILERPDDDEVRLVYADWLLDQGDPRGEFIHAQVALARRGLEEGRAAELHRREVDLLNLFGAQWKAPFEERGWQVEFRRGLPAVPLPRLRPEQSLAEKLARVRPPRVRIGYEVPLGPMEQRELPFVIGVLAGLSGQRRDGRKRLRDRKFLSIDRDNFDEVLRRLCPELHLAVEGGEGPVSVDLAFEQMSDFDPEPLAARVPSSALPALRRHPEFQRLEASWRGLHHLVFLAETSYLLKIRVLDIDKDELRADLDSAIEFDQSETFEKIYSNELDMPCGEPYGLLIGDYELGPTLEDVSLLSRLAQVAVTAFAPFVASASPEFFGPDGFVGLARRRGPSPPAFPEWDAFRSSEASRFVALTMPRVLAPHPSEGAEDGTLWMSAAWAFAVRVADAVARHGWPARLCGVETGRVEELPSRPCPGLGYKETGPAEVALSRPQARELAELGFLPLTHVPGRGTAFLEARSCRAGAAAEARLDHLICVSRLVHCLMTMARTWIGGFMDREGAEHWLSQWLLTFVRPGTATGPDEAPLVWYFRQVLAADDARAPLAEARIEIRAVPSRPGAYRATVWLRPSFQCVGATTTRLVFDLPGGYRG